MSRPMHAGPPATRAARRGAGRHRLGTPTGVRSSDIPALTRANVFLVADPDRGDYSRGEMIRILPK